MNKSDSYREAYLTEKQRAKWTPQQVASGAQDVMKSQALRAELEDAFDEAAGYFGIDSNRFVNMLLNAADKAEAAHNYGAMIRAIELIGKHLGFFVERHEITTTNKSEIQLKSEITFMITANPKLLEFLEANSPTIAENVLKMKKAEPVEALPIIECEVVNAD